MNGYRTLIRLFLPGVLIFGIVAMAGAQQQPDKNPAPKKIEPANTGLVLKELLAHFDKHDATRDGILDREELISVYELPQLTLALNTLDTDKDGRVSRAEYEAWAKEEAPEMARERDEAEAEYEYELKRYREKLVPEWPRPNYPYRSKDRRRDFDRRRLQYDLVSYQGAWVGDNSSSLVIMKNLIIPVPFEPDEPRVGGLFARIVAFSPNKKPAEMDIFLCNVKSPDVGILCRFIFEADKNDNRIKVGYSVAKQGQWFGDWETRPTSFADPGTTTFTLERAMKQEEANKMSRIACSNYLLARAKRCLEIGLPERGKQYFEEIVELYPGTKAEAEAKSWLERSADLLLAQALRRLDLGGTFTEKAKVDLQEILKKYPGTKAEAEAKKLLEKLPE